MFVTKSKRMLAAVLVVGLALGGIRVGVGLSTNPVAGADMQGDQALDGLWEDIENKGGWLRFEGSTIKYHPAGEPDETVLKWTCRYNLTLTPMTIDIFQKDGTAHGIFVFERGTLFIALGQKGAARPTSIERGDRTRLLVLHRANPKTDRGKDVKDAVKEYEKEFLKAINSKTDRGEDRKAILKWINSKADRGKDQKDAAEKGQQSEKSRPRSPPSQKEW